MIHLHVVVPPNRHGSIVYPMRSDTIHLLLLLFCAVSGLLSFVRLGDTNFIIKTKNRAQHSAHSHDRYPSVSRSTHRQPKRMKRNKNGTTNRMCLCGFGWVSPGFRWLPMQFRLRCWPFDSDFNCTILILNNCRLSMKNPFLFHF